MTYHIEMIFGKQCVIENETGFFIILEDIKTQVFAFNYEAMVQRTTLIHSNSREPVVRIHNWIAKNYPEFMV